MEWLSWGIVVIAWLAFLGACIWRLTDKVENIDHWHDRED